MSVVLLVEGVALREAVVYFENRELAVIPLSKFRVVGGYAEKRGEGYAAIVVDSSRGNPGWRDIDTEASRHALQKNQPVADGIFYVVVKDGFGREVRFEIEYPKWTRTEKEDRFTYRNRWWDKASGGTVISGEGAWTDEMTGKICFNASACGP